MVCLVWVFLVPVDSDVVLTCTSGSSSERITISVGVVVWCCLVWAISCEHVQQHVMLFCRVWFDSFVRVVCRTDRRHQVLHTVAHVVLQLWEASDKSSHRVGILSVSTCVRCRVWFDSLPTTMLTCADVLFLRSQDVRLQIHLWHPVLFRKHSVRSFIHEPCCRAHRNRSSASVKQKMVIVIDHRLMCVAAILWQARVWGRRHWNSEHLAMHLFHTTGHR